MIDMDPEPDEVKDQIGGSMKDLGFKVNYQKQEKMDELECYIVYTDLDDKVYTTHSYVNEWTITIVYVERASSNLRRRLTEIMRTVEHDFRTSEVFTATTFKFGKIKIVELGTSYRAEIPCLLREEIDHG
jgi:hypothetical protein